MMSDEIPHGLEHEEDDDIDTTPIINTFYRIPLFDNEFLHMQAMSIVMTDEFFEHQERHLLQRYMEIERTPTEETLFVSALSQLWIFGVRMQLRSPRDPKTIAAAAGLKRSLLQISQWG